MEKMTIGAIRWDAWFKSTKENDPSFQVQRSLSPKKFHFRAPFFAKVTEDDKIFIPEYNQELFDREMEYAKNAGIDYFAYVWYGNPGQDGLSLARRLHETSKYRNDVKMCACLDGNAITRDYAREGISKLFKEDFYKKVLNGRPLVYFFGLCRHYEGMKEDIEYYNAFCERENIPKPYYAVMDGPADITKDIGADAVSAYCVFGSDGVPFKDLAEKANLTWQKKLKECNEAGIGYIPTFTSGWNNQTRHENPVTWIKGDLSKSYVQYATGEEVGKQTEDVITFLKNNKTEINSAIIYAWNEHDEGGWICPTIKVDENGKQLYNDDGTAKINDERIKAVEKAIKNM